MPLSVEPILALPLACSDAASSNRWVGVMRCARRLINRSGRSRIHARSEQLGDFPLENDRVNDHAVAHYVFGSRAKNAAGNGMQHVLLAVKNQGVSGIGPALKTRDDIIFRGQDIDNFAFAFVSPLQAQEHVNLHAF